jgi:hypothetical protein
MRHGGNYNLIDLRIVLRDIYHERSQIEGLSFSESLNPQFVTAHGIENNNYW